MIFASVFFAIWRKSDRRPEVLAFAVSYLMLGIGFTWSQLAPQDAVRLHVKLTNIPYAIGTLLMAWGVARRVGATISLPLAAAVTGITAFFFTVAHFFDGATMVELYIANTGYGILFLLAGQAIAPSRRESAINAAVFWLVSITSFQFLSRPTIAFLIAGPVDFAHYHQSTYYSIVNAVVALNTLGLALSLVGATMIDRFKALQEAAATDGLSGLLIRDVFENRARALIEDAEQQGIAVSLIVGDIDHFKRINDIWGHLVGDKAIARVGAVVGTAIRPSDLAGRIGGEEFAILLWKAEEPIAFSIAERIRRQIARTEIEGLGNNLHITASFGAAQLQPGESYVSLFARADEAMYRAKSGGRDRSIRASDSAPEESMATDEAPLPEQKAVEAVQIGDRAVGA